MHETAIVEALLSSIGSLIEEKGFKSFKKITIYVGELQSLDREVIRDNVIMSLSSLGINVGDVIVEEEKAIFECSRCGFKWGLSDVSFESVRELVHFLPESVYNYIRCPKCGSRDYEVRAGRVLRFHVEV